MITQGCPNPSFRMDLADSKFSAAVIDSTCKRFPGCIEGNGITIEFLRQFCLSDCKTFSRQIRLRERNWLICISGLFQFNYVESFVNLHYYLMKRFSEVSIFFDFIFELLFCYTDRISSSRTLRFSVRAIR